MEIGYLNRRRQTYHQGDTQAGSLHTYMKATIRLADPRVGVSVYSE